MKEAPSVSREARSVGVLHESELEQKKLSVLLGADGSSAHRWLKAGSRQNPSVQILMLFLEKLLLTVRPEGKRDLLSQWERMVTNEGQARTGKDVFKTGKWDRQRGPRAPET